MSTRITAIEPRCKRINKLTPLTQWENVRWECTKTTEGKPTPVTLILYNRCKGSFYWAVKYSTGSVSVPSRVRKSVENIPRWIGSLPYLEKELLEPNPLHLLP